MTSFKFKGQPMINIVLLLQYLIFDKISSTAKDCDCSSILTLQNRCLPLYAMISKALQLCRLHEKHFLIIIYIPTT